MKTKIAQFIVFIFVLLFSFGVIGQEVEQNKPISSIQDVQLVVKLGVEYVLHTGSKGGRYIIRTSKNTGKEYKQYLKEEDIIKLLAATKIN